MKVALLFGGPSRERGISLNSARSLADHLDERFDLSEFIYFDRLARPYALSRAMLYSNTPSDFDFKLSTITMPMSRNDLFSRLRSCDLAFPVMHGPFGEDGALHKILDESGVPYVGTGAAAASAAYDKYCAWMSLHESNIPTVPSTLLTRDLSEEAIASAVERILRDSDRVVLKLAAGGSSLGVEVVDSAAAALDRLNLSLFGEEQYNADRVVAQPWISGVEFTIVVIEGPSGPVALIPLEIERHRRANAFEILSYRHKYLPNDDTAYRCPPNFSDELIEEIRSTAEQVFETMQLRDFARVDGWVDANGRVLISDINVISGMEQNSFLFIQAAQVGLTHGDVLSIVISSACRRAGIPTPTISTRRKNLPRRRVGVLFGGVTAERQVSVLSGTNVWMKLRTSDRYEPLPALLAKDGSVWQLPYALALRHTAEEIADACESAEAAEPRRQRLAQEIVARLQLTSFHVTLSNYLPENKSLDDFVRSVDFVFIALHGGVGEDGTLQSRLDELGIPYNGSDAASSRLCMDKYETGLRISLMNEPYVSTAAKVKVRVPEAVSDALVTEIYDRASAECGTRKLVVKPVSDGCSAGVVPLAGPAELRVYLDAVRKRVERIEPGFFSLVSSEQIVDLPTEQLQELLLEAYIESDVVSIVEPSCQSDVKKSNAAHLAWKERDGGRWVEVTAGVLGPQGEMRCFYPSLTVAREGVLTLEEKFMGGTGVNITPPPAPPLGKVSQEAVKRAREKLAIVANHLGLQGYARIDAFLDRQDGRIIVIEVNSLPGLTPSTVIYHQALADDHTPMFPREFLEHVIDLGFAANVKREVSSYPLR
ncbi:MAG: hypothetical protein ACRDSZ_23630 [Pseudonocardiaceae bacterium]